MEKILRGVLFKKPMEMCRVGNNDGFTAALLSGRPLKI
jgi:hypothetical protein